jgi:hypothetical protein
MAKIAKEETASLISADKVEGTSVYNTGDEKIGTIDDVMIDKRSGHVAYAVMSFGGFLGMGEKYHPLPWQVLHYDTAIDGYRVDLDKKALEGAPAYDRSELDTVNWDDAAWNRTVADYYRVPPFNPGL